MPRDCPNSRCTFFLSSRTALCPSCGHRVDPINWARVALGGFAIIGVLLVVPVRSSLVAGIAMVVVLFAAVIAARAPRRPTTAITTLEQRYGEAVDDAELRLEQWGTLFALHAEVASTGDQDRLSHEALAAATEAANEAVHRRNHYASRFIANGFERLEHSVARVSGRPSAFESSEVKTAAAVIEHYIETLWIDDEITRQARTRLERTLPSQTDRRLLEAANSLRLFESSSTCDFEPDPDAHRFRLQAERQLLHEARQADADFFDQTI